MNISEFYKYSWFADLAYVEWDNNHLSGTKAIEAAVLEERAPHKLAENII